MRALMFNGPGDLEWQEQAEPQLQADDDAIVRPIAATTCDLDTAILAGLAPFPGPFAIGHECVAEVLDVGPAAGTLRPGQKVVVPWHIACGACSTCMRGRTAHCERVPRHAMFGIPLGGVWGGLFSDRVRVPYAGKMLVPLPAGVTPRAAVSCSDNLTDAYGSVAGPLAERPGAEVLVLGGGARSIGLYTVAIARALGAGRVSYWDRDAQRRERAERLGATIVDRGVGDTIGPFPIVVDASANPDVLAWAIRSTAAAGACTSVGIYFMDAPLPLLHLYMEGVSFRLNRSNVRPLIPDVLALLATGRLDPDAIGITVASFDDAVEVLRRPPMKAVLLRAE